MTDANEIRLQITHLNQEAHKIILSLRQTKAQLENLATAYGNISPELQNVEFMLAAAEKMIDDPLDAIHTSVNRVNQWAYNL